MSLVRCRLCGAESASTDRGPSDLALRHCAHCDVLFLSTGNVEAYANEVEQRFFSQMRAGKWQRWLDRQNARIVLRRIQKLKSKGKLLEIGVGRGVFLREAERAGYDCSGIEPSAGLVRNFRSYSSIPMFHGTLQDFVQTTPHQCFDVVVMNHVLEHMPDPLTALDQIRSLLTDSGIAHIAVPNVAAWESRLPGWTSYEPYHLFYFSASALQGISQRVGFHVIRQDTREPFSGWTNALLRTFMQRHYRELRCTGSEPAMSKNRALAKALLEIVRIVGGSVTFPIRHVQARLQRGEELITIVSRA